MPYGTQTARLAEGLQRFFGIQGHLPLQLVDDVFPFVDLAHLPPDIAGLADIRQFHLSVLAPAAGAGNYSRAKVSNESANRITVLHGWDLETNANSSAELLMTTGGAAGTVTGPIFTDTRYGGEFDPAATGRFDSVAIAPSGPMVMTHELGFLYLFPCPVVLLPGWAVQFTNVTANDILRLRTVGYTRPLTVGET